MSRKYALPDEGLLFVEAASYDDLKPAFDFIHGMLHDSTVAIIYGPPGSGKTFFAIHLLCSAALGRVLFGVTPEKRDGLYIGLEGEANVKTRIMAWCAQNKVDENPIDYALGSFDIGGEDDVPNLIAHIKKRRIGFVVIDTLALTMIGLDEIAGKDMSLVINALHRIKRETGACVVAIAHTGKNEKAGIRGHSSQLGNVDTSIEIQCHNRKAKPGGRGQSASPEERITIDTPRSATVRKQRDGEGGRKYFFKLNAHVTGVKTARGDTMRSLALDEHERFPDLLDEEGDAAAAPPPAKLTARQRDAMAILDTLTRKMGRAGPPTCDQFKRALRREGWPGGKVTDMRGATRDLLKALEAKGAIYIDAESYVEPTV